MFVLDICDPFRVCLSFVSTIIKVNKMARFRRWVCLNTVGLTIALGLTGCGSSQNAATVTPVTTTTTNVVPSKPPGVSAAPNMDSNPSAMAGHGGPMAPPGGTGSSATMDPAAMMKAHSAMPPGGSAMPPGGAAGSSSASMDPASMKAHAGGASAPSGGASSAMMDPAAAMKAHTNGAPNAPGTAGATMDPAAMMKAHGNSAPPGGAAGAGGAMAGASSGSDMPRAPGGPGGLGGPGGPGGGQQGTNFPAGSIEDSIYRFCVAMADGDTAAAAEFLGSKAKGLVGQLREGELSEEKVEEIQNALSPITELQPNPGQNNTKRSLRNKKNQVISFTMKKDKDDDRFKIVELSISKPKNR